MRHYLLDVELHSGEIIRGTSKNTHVLNKEEFLVIEKVASKTQEIRLDKIKQITALDYKAVFKTIKIS